MRTVVHLRHAERQPGSVHLSDGGERRAHELGRRLARFDRVLTSPKPRAVETAEAMGYPVHGEVAEFAGLPEEIDGWVDRYAPRSFADYVALVQSDPSARAQAGDLAERLRNLLAAIADGGRLLVVSHGGVVELSAVGALGRTTAAWGHTLEPLEGVELRLAPLGWQGGAVLRHD